MKFLTIPIDEELRLRLVLAIKASGLTQEEWLKKLAKKFLKKQEEAA